MAEPIYLYGIRLEVLTAWVSLLGPIAGLIVGSKLTKGHQERQRKLELNEKQLREFYAPLWAMRLEIKTLSEYRLTVEGAMSSEAQGLIDQFGQPEGLDDALEQGESISRITDAYTTDIPYNNEMLEKVLLPMYRQMQELFRDRLHLAHLDTVDYFPILVRYNESWKRSNETTMPFTVAKAVQVKEAELHPFYAHLEARCDQLKAALANGKPLTVLSRT